MRSKQRNVNITHNQQNTEAIIPQQHLKEPSTGDQIDLRALYNGMEEITRDGDHYLKKLNAPWIIIRKIGRSRRDVPQKHRVGKYLEYNNVPQTLCEEMSRARCTSNVLSNTVKKPLQCNGMMCTDILLRIM